MDFNQQKFIKTKLLIENHVHGAYGVDFNSANCDEIICLSKTLLKHGVGGFFPTLVSDTVENLKKQVEIIKHAKSVQTEEMAEILGVHLEGTFINPLKKGIQDEKLFLPLNVENYKLIEDEMIKIVTLAPELDEGLIDYLKKKGVKVQAGHCIGGDLSKVDGATHLFNAMSSISHREPSTALSALIDDDIYTEVIMDLIHLSNDTLRLILKSKPEDKILPVSDCLPIAYGEKTEMDFCDKKVFYDGKKITSKNGTLAGSALLLNDILKKLSDNGIDALKYIDNLYKYHDIEIVGNIYWNEDYEIVAIEKGNTVLYRD